MEGVPASYVACVCDFSVYVWAKRTACDETSLGSLDRTLPGPQLLFPKITALQKGWGVAGWPRHTKGQHRAPFSSYGGGAELLSKGKCVQVCLYLHRCIRYTGMCNQVFTYTLHLNGYTDTTTKSILCFLCTLSPLGTPGADIHSDSWNLHQFPSTI